MAFFPLRSDHTSGIHFGERFFWLFSIHSGIVRSFFHLQQFPGQELLKPLYHRSFGRRPCRQFPFLLPRAPRSLHTFPQKPGPFSVFSSGYGEFLSGFLGSKKQEKAAFRTCCRTGLPGCFQNRILNISSDWTFYPISIILYLNNINENHFQSRLYY